MDDAACCKSGAPASAVMVDNPACGPAAAAAGVSSALWPCARAPERLLSQRGAMQHAAVAGMCAPAGARSLQGRASYLRSTSERARIRPSAGRVRAESGACMGCMHACVPRPMLLVGALRACLCGAVRRVEAGEETARFARCPLVCLGHRRRARTLLPDAHRRAAHHDRHQRFMLQGQLWLCGHALSCMGCRCALKAGMCLNKARHHL